MGEKSMKQVPIGGVACRESLSISDSLLENSNPDRLVEYIRAKRNLPRPKELFSNVFNKDKPRKSFKLQLEPYQRTSPSPEKKGSKHQSEIIEISSDNDKQQNNSSEKILLPRILLRKKEQPFDYHPHARKVLLNEFESTIKSNEFLPPVFSTPLSFDAGDNQLSKNGIIDQTNNNKKPPQKKSLLRQTVKPLTPNELESAKLIENLANEHMKNNAKNGSNVSLNKSTNSQNFTLRISSKDIRFDEELCENLEISDKSILPDQIIINEVQQEENLNSDSIKKLQSRSSGNSNFENPETNHEINQHKTKSNNNNTKDTDTPISETQDCNDKNTANNLHVPETEEFEIHNISDSLIIPETQEHAINLNNVQENSSCIVNQDYPEKQLENCNKTDIYLPPKSPNRRTFVIHKLNNTITPPRRHSISKDNCVSPKSVPIPSSSQMSPLARCAQSQLRLNNGKTSQNFVKANLQSRIPKSIRTPSSIRNNSVIRNIQLSQNINEIEHINEMIPLEYRENALPIIVIPIHQTVNTSPTHTALSSPLPPPDEFCDDTTVKSTNILKPKTNLNIIDKENRLTYPIPENELMTDDEDISLLQNNIENRKLINHKSPIKNKNANVANRKSKETMEANNLYSHRLSTKRKSSINANNLINCYYDEVNLKKNRNIEDYNREVEKLRNKYKINSNNSISIDLTTDNINRNDITARFTPPPPIQLSEDDDFLFVKEYHYIDNQQQKEEESHSEKQLNKINSIRINGSRTLNNMKRHHEISLDRNFIPIKEHEFIDSEKQNNISQTGQETIDRQQTSQSFGKFSHKNRKTNENISMTKSRNSPKNKLNLPDNIADVEINNDIFLNNNNQSQFKKSSQSREIHTLNHANNLEKNICKPNILSNIQIVPSSSGKYSKHSKSPILSRCTTLAILKMNNFNRNNDQLLETEEQEVKSDGNKKNHKAITHKSRSRKRSNRRSSPSSSTSPEKMSLINNKNTTVVNVDEEVVIDDPRAMDNYWRYSIASNKSQKTVKTKRNENDNSLKNFYLNVDKTINNINLSTLSGRRKLYSKGESDIERTPKKIEHTPTKNTDNNNLKLNNKSLITTTTLEENKQNRKNKSTKNNSIQMDIQADLDNIDEFNVDNENPNITEQNQNQNSFSNNFNKNVTDKTTNKEDNYLFKIPTLPVPKTLKKNKSKHQNHNITSEFENEKYNNEKSKESVEPKPKQDITNNEESDNTSQFGTPRRTSTKIANNIEKYLKGGKRKNELEKLKLKNSRRDYVIPSNVDNIDSVDNTNTVRRSNRKPCPRVEYWTNERTTYTIKADIIVVPVSKQLKKQIKNKSKINEKNENRNLQLIEQNNNKLVPLNEENENPSQPSLDPLPVSNNKPKDQSKNKSQMGKKQKKNEETINEVNEYPSQPAVDPLPVSNNKSQSRNKSKNKKQKKNEETINEEHENLPETPPDFENQLSQLVDILKESFTENRNEKGLHRKSDVKNKRYSNKNRKKYKNKNKIDGTIHEKEINTKQHTIVEPVPSSSKAVVAENEEGTAVNYDSGNGTDVNYATKGHDAFSWLKKLVDSNASNSTSSSSKLLVERLAERQGLELAYFNEMCSVEKAGVEYYFCNSSTQNYGFIKLKPNLTKPLSKLKRYDINFILFVGELDFFVSDKPLNNIKAGAVVKIKRNSHYSITNSTDSDALLLFMKFE